MASKIHTRFQTWPLGNCQHYSDKNDPPPKKKKKISENLFRIRAFLFLSYSFGIETINTFIHSRSSLDNHTRFQDKTRQKSYPLGGAHTYSYVAYAREYPWGFSLAWENNKDKWPKDAKMQMALCCVASETIDSESKELPMLLLGYARHQSRGLLPW